jgi:putative tricarboxylic transport membrane protein
MPFRDAIAGFAMAILSLVLFIGTWEFSDVSGYMSPQVFPRLVALVLFAFSMVLAVRSLFAVVRVPASAWPRWQAECMAAWRRYRPLVVVVAASFAYVYAMETVGYVVATVLYVGVTVFLYGERRWPVVAIMGIGGGLVLYATFRLLFQVPLPRFDLF